MFQSQFPSFAAVCALTAIALSATGAVWGDDQSTTKFTYDENVREIFKQRCSACHNPNKKSGDLDVTNFTNLMQGGSSGAVIERGDVESSYLFALVSRQDEPAMPPDGAIPQTEIDLIKTWIEQGALENQASKFVVAKKPIVITGSTNFAEPPPVVAAPPRLIKQPVVHTERSGVVRSIATSPWAPLAAVAGQLQVVLYHTQTLELTGILPFPEGTVNVVRFSRNGQLLLAGGGKHGASGKVVIWDVATGDRIREIGDELDAVMAADISADHQLVALGGTDRKVSVYATETGELKYSLTKHTDWVTAIEFSVDGVLLATGDRNGGLRVWESFTGREYLTLNGHSAAINGLSWRLDSNVLASASNDTTIRLWEMENGSQIKSWGAHGGGAAALEFTRDGRILSTGRDRVTKLWGQDGGQIKVFPAASEIALSASWCDQTGRAIAGDFGGDIRVWQESDAAQLAQWTPNPPNLDTRLNQAKAELDQRQSELAPLKQNLDQVAAQVTDVENRLAEAQKIQAAAEQAVSGLDNQIKTANVEKTETDQKRSQLAAKLTRINEAKPLVAEALRNLVEAASKLTDNPAIQQYADALTQQLKQMDVEVTQLSGELDGLATKMTETTSQLAAASDQMQQAQQELTAANENVATLNAQLPPLQQQKQEAAAALDNVTKAIQAVESQVARWQSEIDFVNLLSQLERQLDAAQQNVIQHQQELDSANSKLTDAQAAVDAARQSIGTAQGQVSNILEEIAKAKNIKQ